MGALITFVVSNQSGDTENRALDTSLKNSLNLDINHVITKRDAKKDLENKKRSKKKNGKRRKRLERKKKDKSSKKRSKKNKKRSKKKNGLKKNQNKAKKKKRADRKKKNSSKSAKKGKKKRNKNKASKGRKNKGKKGKSEKKRKNRKNKKRLSRKQKQKLKNKRRKDQRKSKKKKEKLTKKQRKLRNKKRKNPKKSSRQSSCSANQANYQCMEAALKGMMFEQQQITNYLKQSKLLERHQSVSGNKRSKKVIFEEAEQHLLWAIGGDIDNPICGPSDKSSSKYNSTLYEKEKNLAVESYKLLKECDIEIEKSCNISNLEGYNKDGVAENTICQNMMQDAIAANKLCQSLTEDVAAQCACWINQTTLIDKIKAFKCQAKADQKKVTQFKNKCIDTFKACKKMEDKSVESVYYCMEDHSMKFINQTVESLANAADKNAETAGKRAAFEDRNQLQLQEYLDDNLILF